MPKKIVLIPAIGYTIVLAIVSLMAITTPLNIGTNYDDKIFHIFAYGILFILWYFTLLRLKTAMPIFKAVLFSVFYGIIIEVLQGQFTIVRKLDILDVLANCIGVMIASFFIIIRNRTIVKNL